MMRPIGLMCMWIGCARAAEPATVGGPLTVPSTTPFEIAVMLDAAASAEMTRKKEAITVDFMVCDSGPDAAATCHSHRAELGSEGGAASIPVIALTPGPAGLSVTHASVNVFTARRSSDRNLLNCAPWLGEVSTLPRRVEVVCTLL